MEPSVFKYILHSQLFRALHRALTLLLLLLFHFRIPRLLTEAFLLLIRIRDIINGMH